MDLGLKGKTALITGASAGIGYETAKILGQEGAQTIIVARRRHELNALADEIAKAGGLPPLVIVEDAASKDASLRIRKEVIARFGALDILINNLGQARPFTMNNPDSDWDEAFNLNFTTARKLTEAFLDGMIAQGFGRVLCMTATSEPFGMSGSLTSKAALLIWAKGLSRMVAKNNVTVNCVSPGFLMTDQIKNHFIPRVVPNPEDQEQFLAREIPAGHFGEPSDAAGLIAFLCSPRAGYITGQRIYVDGGWNRHV